MSSSDPTDNPEFEKELLKGLVKKLKEILDGDERLSAAEITAIHRVLSDNSISFSSIRAGSFGEVAKRVSEEFPFDADGNVVAIKSNG
jgi:hypothetical protein